jgi:hypothetical protein
MQQQFDQVVRVFCAAQDILAAQPVIDGDSITLDDVEFSFVYDDADAPAALFLRVVFGALPLKNETPSAGRYCIRIIWATWGKGRDFAYRPRLAAWCICCVWSWPKPARSGSPLP